MARSPPWPARARRAARAMPAAQINQPYALAVDRLGNVYIGEYGGARVRKVTPGGTISTIAGNGRFGTRGDGGPATSAEIADMGIAIDATGNLYIADGVSLVRKVSRDGIISTVAGGGTATQDGVRRRRFSCSTLLQLRWMPQETCISQRVTWLGK